MFLVPGILLFSLPSCLRIHSVHVLCRTASDFSCAFTHLSPKSTPPSHTAVPCSATLCLTVPYILIVLCAVVIIIIIKIDAKYSIYVNNNL